MDIIRKRKKNLHANVNVPQTKGGSTSLFSSNTSQPLPVTQKTTSTQYDSWSERKLNKELARIEKFLTTKQEENLSIATRRQELERLEEASRFSLIQLFEAQQTLRASYINLLSYVHREVLKYKHKQRELPAALEAKRKKERLLEELLAGLGVRLLRNKKFLWEMQKSELRVKIQAKLHEQETLSREIQILRAHKEQTLHVLSASKRNEERSSLLSRRRGKIISGLDLHTLSQNLEQFGKKKDLHVSLDEVITTKAEYVKVRDALMRGIQELQQREEVLLEEKAKLSLAFAKVCEEKSELTKSKREKFSWSSFSLKKISKRLQPSFVAFSIFALLVPGTLGAVSYANHGIAAKSYVLGATTEGVDAAKSAGSNLVANNIPGATQDLTNATNSFSQAQKALQSLGPLVDITKDIPGLSQISTANKLIDAAKNISLASARLTQVASAYSSVPTFLPENLAGSAQGSTKDNANATMIDALTNTQSQVAEADKLLMQASQDLQDASWSDIPKDYQEKLKPVFDVLPSLASTFHTFAGFYGQLPVLFGVDQQRKYLLLFLNNNELRGAGGFLGSFGLMDVDQGKINNIKVVGIYDPDGQFQERLTPPAALRVIIPRWFMRDVVWYPDFPAIAEKATDFYEKSEGPSVDGVISFTPTIFQNLLKVTGPIEVPEQHTTVNAENFIDVTQYKVEIDYDKNLNQPKKFLGDMIPHLVQKLTTLPQEKILDVASVFADAMAQKHMQVYFKNAELEQKAKDAGLAGEIKDAPRDFLSIVNNNVLGNKTDLLINESIQHNVEIASDGTTTDQLTVTRTHTGTNAWPSGRNREFISIFVPKNSKLLSYSGFDSLEATDIPTICEECKDDPLVSQIESGKPFPNSGITTYEEFGKTVFAGWQYLDAGATKTYTLKYELPFKVSIDFFHPASTYSVLVQKQAGSLGSKYRLEMKIPQKYFFNALAPRGLQDIAVVKSGSNATFETTLMNDRFLGAVITK